MIVQNTYMVPDACNRLNLTYVWKGFLVHVKMSIVKCQVQLFSEIIQRKLILIELKPGLYGKAVKLSACKFLLSQNITFNWKLRRTLLTPFVFKFHWLFLKSIPLTKNVSDIIVITQIFYSLSFSFIKSVVDN